MNKKRFSDLVDSAIRDCPKFRKIDEKFMKPFNHVYDSNINNLIAYFNMLKQQALDHFKICNNKYCKQICLHNLRNKHD